MFTACLRQLAFLAYLLLTYAGVFAQENFARVKLSTSGHMSAKADPASDEVTGTMLSLNHHGAYYADLDADIGISKGASMLLRLNLQNPSLSENRKATVDWFLRGKFEKDFWKTSEEEHGYSWRIEAGNFHHWTIGNGLTIKDVNPVGFSSALNTPRTWLRTSLWAQDYNVPGDILVAEFLLKRFHLGFNAMLWLYEQGSDFRSVYLLPNFSMPIGSSRLYGEAGLEIPEREELDENNVGNSPEAPWAMLFGWEISGNLRGWTLGVNPELRFYRKNFIPMTQVEEEAYTSLYNYDKSSNNWIDFFSSVEDNFWSYLKVSLESPAWHGISVFGENELLIFSSPQDLFFDKRSGALIQFTPSSNFYWTGLRYSHSQGVHLEFLATNRLINIDPLVNRRAGNDLPLMQYGDGVRRQYGTRYYSAKNPILEMRAVWRSDGL